MVIKAISGFYTVRTAVGDTHVCKLPGRMRRERQSTDLVAVGDRVTFELDVHNDEQMGSITAVAERQQTLSRTRPSARNRQLSSDREQVLVANVDQVIFVCALRQPEVNLRKIDRFLVVAEKNKIPAVICVNKVDLGSLEEAQALFAIYEQLGYGVIYTSVLTGLGVAELRAQLQNRLSVLSGSSGVGKSSLLNAVEPTLGLSVKQVSEATGKGMHTTRYAELIPLVAGGYVADTPGIRGVALYDVEADELDAYFIEIAPLVANCQFSDCTHRQEPDCAVLAAVARGEVSAARYDSYLRLRDEHESLADAAY